jgi:hypothetical protein
VLDARELRVVMLLISPSSAPRSRLRAVPTTKGRAKSSTNGIERSKSGDANEPEAPLRACPRPAARHSAPSRRRSRWKVAPWVLVLFHLTNAVGRALLRATRVRNGYDHERHESAAWKELLDRAKRDGRFPSGTENRLPANDASTRGISPPGVQPAVSPEIPGIPMRPRKRVLPNRGASRSPWKERFGRQRLGEPRVPGSDPTRPIGGVP